MTAERGAAHITASLGGACFLCSSKLHAASKTFFYCQTMQQTQQETTTHMQQCNKRSRKLQHVRSFFGQQASLQLLQGSVNDITWQRSAPCVRTFTLSVKCSIKLAEP
jgi:hypothetical protein